MTKETTGRKELMLGVQGMAETVGFQLEVLMSRVRIPETSKKIIKKKKYEWMSLVGERVNGEKKKRVEEVGWE